MLSCNESTRTRTDTLAATDPLYLVYQMDQHMKWRKAEILASVASGKGFQCHFCPFQEVVWTQKMNENSLANRLELQHLYDLEV